MHPHYGFQPWKSRKGNTQLQTYRWQQFRWIDGTKVPRSAGSHGDFGTTALSTLHAACRMPLAARERSGFQMVVYNVAYATPRHTPSGLAGPARTARSIHHMSTPLRQTSCTSWILRGARPSPGRSIGPSLVASRQAPGDELLKGHGWLQGLHPLWKKPPRSI